MKILFQTLGTFIVFIASFYFIYWVPFSIIPCPPWLAPIISLVCAVIAAKGT